MKKVIIDLKNERKLKNYEELTDEQRKELHSHGITLEELSFQKGHGLDNIQNFLRYAIAEELSLFAKARTDILKEYNLLDKTEIWPLKAERNTGEISYYGSITNFYEILTDFLYPFLKTCHYKNGSIEEKLFILKNIYIWYWAMNKRSKRDFKRIDKLAKKTYTIYESPYLPAEFRTE